MKPGLGGMIKKAAQMKENLEKVQEELEHKTVVGASAGGAVRVTMNGRYACVSVALDDKILQEDKDMLEDLLAAAITDASTKASEMAQEEMAAVTQGLGLPMGFKMPF